MNERKIRVLIIDDSAVVRKVVSETLAAQPDIEVVGTAMDPYLARDKIVQLKPDVLTLDIEMPRMDGLTFLKIIMQERPMPVIIMSSLTKAGSHHAMEALRLGAIDVLGKPGGSYSVGDLGPQLVEKIRAAAQARIRRTPLPTIPPFPVKPTAPAPAAPPAAAASPTLAAKVVKNTAKKTTPPPPAANQPPTLRVLSAPAVHHPRRLILLGASTGGTEALREVLTKLPGDLPGIAIVQHIPAHFSRTFAERLNATCAFEVREAIDGDILVPGTCLIAPGNYHMMLQWVTNCYRVRLSQGPMVWHQRPAVDLLFKSAVDLVGHRAIAGILTGMGKDGAEGLLKLREAGAMTFSQDEATSVVYGMPRVAWECGGSQTQLPLERIAEHIVKLVGTPPTKPETTPAQISA